MRLYPAFVRGAGAVGLLLVRLATGGAFMFHGWYKLQSPGGATGWMPAEAHMPGYLQGLAVLAEFGGGIALVLGLLTPLAALGIAATMGVALGTVHLPAGHPFVAPVPGQPSFELAAVYLANVLMLLLVGPGALSVDAVLFGRRTSPADLTGAVPSVTR